MNRILMIGAVGVALSLGVVSANADWLGESNNSGSMYQPPRLRANAAENYAGVADARALGAYDVGVYLQPAGPAVLAEPPADD